MTIDVLEFKDKFRWLSNFYPCRIMGPGNFPYSSLEHAYQASKSLNPQDWEVIFWAESPGKAKKIGQTLSIRNDWSDIKLAIMSNLLRQKFKPGHFLDMLLEIDGIIVEGNHWGDKFWGVDIKTRVGQNHLGKILMQIRDEAKCM